MALTTIPASLSATALTLTTAAQPNITSVGTLTGLTVSGNASVTANLPTFTITGQGRVNGFEIAGTSGDTTLTEKSNNGITLGTNNTSRLRIQNNGDISFYEDTGTTPKFFWDSSTESLGIGTTPAHKLHVADATTPEIIVEDTTNNVKAVLGADNSVGRIGTDTNHPVTFRTNDTERMRIDSSGNVGITGQTSPTFNLDGGFVTQTWGWHLNTSYQAGFTYTTTDRSLSIFTKSADNADYIKFSTGGSATERMRIDFSGRVGIGISNPTEKFTVVNSSSGIVGRFTNNTNQTLDLGVISGSGAAGGVYYNNANSGYHAFQVGGTERWRINPNGVLVSGGNTAVGVGGTPADANFIEVGAGYINLARDDTADADQIVFAKNGAIHTKLKTINGAFVIDSASGNVHVTANSNSLNYNGSTLKPFDSDDTNIDLGTSGARWKDLYLSGGVNFSDATGGTTYSAGNAANTLDDYEEGTYTATPTVQSGTVSIDSSYDQLAYTKIGRNVTINGRIRLSTTSASGYFRIALPFVVANNLPDESDFGFLDCVGYNVGIPTDARQTFAEGSPGNQYAVLLYSRDNASWTYWNANNFSSGDIIYLSGTYMTT